MAHERRWGHRERLADSISSSRNGIASTRYVRIDVISRSELTYTATNGCGFIVVGCTGDCSGPQYDATTCQAFVGSGSDPTSRTSTRSFHGRVGSPLRPMRQPRHGDASPSPGRRPHHGDGTDGHAVDQPRHLQQGRLHCRRLHAGGACLAGPACTGCAARLALENRRGLGRGRQSCRQGCAALRLGRCGWLVAPCFRTAQRQR